MNATSDIVQKLWNLCHVLRDDGISYLQYVTELTYLLFLKMMQETGQKTPSSRRASAGTTSPAATGWSS
jgi:type I restriction-modification system DNA methylase subunit